MEEHITTLKLTPNAQVWLQHQHDTTYMEFQVSYDPNEFGDYCIAIDTLYDIDTLLEDLNTLGLDNFITKYENNFL